MHDGVQEARQESAIIGEDVAVVEGYRIHQPRGLYVAEAVPDVAALTELSRREAQGL